LIEASIAFKARVRKFLGVVGQTAKSIAEGETTII
jgi:hypothetical protein